MRDIIDQLESWVANEESIAIATVVSTWGSSPRKVGSKMAVRSDGTMIGSVSGGCVEGAVAEAAMKILEGTPPQLLKFGVSDETAWDVGLACGGSIEVFVQKLDEEILTKAASQIKSNQTIGLISLIKGPEHAIGKQLLIGLDANVLAGNIAFLKDLPEVTLQAALDKGESGRLETGTAAGRKTYFLDVVSAPRKLVMIGGVHISIALAEMAKTLGFETIVIDPRRLFASDERFPDVDILIQSWPLEAYEQVSLDRETAVAVLTHDPKIDDPAIIGALEMPVFYIGVLGSRKTHAKRVKRLQKAGINNQQLKRLHAPIGLNIGAQSPEEIALSILAEITTAQHNPTSSP
jgi:xanthine dehydrogenase accessory factor